MFPLHTITYPLKNVPSTEAECLGRMGLAARGSGTVALSKALQDDRDASVRRTGMCLLGQHKSLKKPWGFVDDFLGET